MGKKLASYDPAGNIIGFYWVAADNTQVRAATSQDAVKLVSWG